MRLETDAAHLNGGGGGVWVPEIAQKSGLKVLAAG